MSKYVNSWEEAAKFVKAELVKCSHFTNDFEHKLIRKAMKKFGLSEETVAGIERDMMQELAEERKAASRWEV